ncbi:hypothetical protein PMAYCL1PPCAC_17875, partial [Pristionchus mayeri]
MGEPTGYLVVLLSFLSLVDAIPDCSSVPYDSLKQKVTYNCPQQGYTYPEGCTGVIHCINNHYFEKYNQGLYITCKANRWMVDGNYELPSCIKGCKALDDNVEMKNATYIGAGKPPLIYMSQGIYYWPSGTTIETNCKPDFVFKKVVHREQGKDSHVCQGGMEGWKDTVNAYNPGQAPGKCDPVCKVFTESDLPPNVYIKATAKAVIVNGKSVLTAGSGVQFECKEGSKYPDGEPFQRFVCKGGAAGYQDLTWDSSPAVVKSCDTLGCTRIDSSNVDPSAFLSYDGCEHGSSVYKDGCTVTIKCNNKNSYFDKPENSAGMSVTCRGGAWVNPLNRTITPLGGKYGDPCIVGCPVLSHSEMRNAEYVGPLPSASNQLYYNGDNKIYAANVKLTTKCKDGFSRENPSDDANEPNVFNCIPIDGWTNTKTGRRDQKPGGCLPSCKISTASIKGSSYSFAPSDVTTSNGQQYLRAGGSFETRCDDGFEAPAGQSAPQKITCKDGSLVDSSTNSPVGAPLTCVKSGAKGCEMVAVPNGKAEKDGCEMVDGLMKEKCKVTLTCSPGFAPSGSAALNDGKQILECKAGNDGWIDQQGNKNAKPLECVPVCEMPTMDRAEVVTAPDSKYVVNVEGKEYVKTGATVSIKCKSPFVGRTEPERSADKIDYKCMGGNDGWSKPATSELMKTPGDACASTCSSVEPSTGQAIVLSPQTFELNGEPKVIEGGKYRLVCKDGFKFPPDTKAAQKNMQNVVCEGGEKGYVDADTKEKTKIESCERGEQPGCNPSIDPSSLPPSKIVKQSDKCTTSNDRSSVGCKITLGCADGYYPKSPEMQLEKEQTLECKDNGTSSYWNEPKSGQPVTSMLECLPGCKEGVGKNAQVVRATRDKINIGDTTYYKENAQLKVKCNDESTYKYGTPYSPNPEMTYTCTGGNFPWTNEEQGRLEKAPGDLCARICEAFDAPAGLRFTETPPVNYINGIRAVKGEGMYKLTCANGYHFPAGTPYEKNNEQILICDSDNGKLKDVTNG